MAVTELALLHNVAYNTSNHTIKSLKRDGLVHIGSWEQPVKGRPAAVWCLGEGEDAPRPGPIPKSLKNARNDARRKRLRQRQQAGVWGGLL